MLNLTESQRALQEAARKLAQGEFKDRARRWDETEEFPEDNQKRLAELGYIGMSIDEKFGGGGCGLVDTYLVVEEIAKVCMTTALIVHEQNVSPRIIALHGTDAQREKYLPMIAKGQLGMTIAWTEPQAGSEGTAIRTTCKKDGNEYVVNGQKVFTSFGDHADMHMAYVRFGDTKGARGLGTVLIEADRPGITVQKLEGKMGTRGCHEVELFFDDVRIPAENILIEGDPNSSKGFVKALNIYNGTRVGMGILALGVAQGAFDMATEYMTKRVQFGQPLSEMQGLQWMVADMAIDLEAARLLCYRALELFDQGTPSPYLSSVAKVQATEMAQKVCYDSMQMFGGYGYFGSLPLERMVRDVRMLTITGGTTQIQKTAIAKHIFSQVESRK